MPDAYRWAKTFICGDPPGESVCPTCGESGSDRIDRDYDSGRLEAACGDEWHAQSDGTP